MYRELKRYGDWWVLRHLGSGGQGSVYESIRIPNKKFSNFEEDVRSTRAVTHVDRGQTPLLVHIFGAFELFARSERGALKVLHPLEQAKNAASADARLEREVRALQDFRHPALVRILDSDIPKRWYVMELFSEGTLENALGRFRGQWVPSLQALRPIVEAVAHVHDRGHVHRDIKPGNVFVTQSGLVLGDFGLVYGPDVTRLTDTSENVGSRDWMPTWAVGMRMDEVPASFDVFSLGKTLWAMLSGRSFLRFHYFKDPEFDLEKMFPNSSWPSSANALLAKCIVDRKDDALKNAGVLLAEIDHILRPPG